MGLRTRLKSKARAVARRVLDRMDSPTDGDDIISSGPSEAELNPKPEEPTSAHLDEGPREAELTALEEELATEEEATEASDDERVEEALESDEEWGPYANEKSETSVESERPPKLTGKEAESLQAEIIAAIETIFDPEIPVNIYELGLIYEVNVHEGNAIFINMTLTSPNCPAAQSLPVEVKDKTESVNGVLSAEVSIVWDPVWGPHLMTEAARLELNL